MIPGTTKVEYHARYQDVSLFSDMLVDNCAMQIVKDPSQFDVVVTENMFGDILSDECSQITGSIGLLPSASLGDTTCGMYEPIHGSAPDIAGKGLADPLAAIWSASQMLDFFGHEDWGKKVLCCIETALMEKCTLTPDLGGSSTTCQVGDKIVKLLEQ